MDNNVRCTKCGSKNLQTVVKTDVQTQGKNYSASQGCCGALLLGPFGLLCGLCGQGKKTTTTNVSMFSCNNCGHEFKKREELQKEADNAGKMKSASLPISIAMAVIMIIVVLVVAGGTDAVGFLIFSIIALWGVVGAVMFFMYNSMEKKAREEIYEYERLQKYFAEKNKR